MRERSRSGATSADTQVGYRRDDVPQPPPKHAGLVSGRRADLRRPLLCGNGLEDCEVFAS